MPDTTFPTGTANLDAGSYVPGAVVTLTVVRSDPDSRTGTVTVQLADASGNTTPVMVTLTVGDPVTVAVSDTLTHTWTLLSDDGRTAKYTTVA